MKYDRFDEIDDHSANMNQLNHDYNLKTLSDRLYENDKN